MNEAVQSNCSFVYFFHIFPTSSCIQCLYAVGLPVYFFMGSNLKMFVLDATG